PAMFPAIAPCGSPEEWATGRAPPDPPVVIPDSWVPDCCGAPLPPPPPPADPCEVNVWILETAGFFSGGDHWNGHFEIPRYPGFSCRWVTFISIHERWALGEDGPGPPTELQLSGNNTLTGFASGFWTIPLSSLDLTPGASNTLTLFPGSSDCAT